MKKLTILVAAVMFATVTQAASVYWTATNVYSGNDTDLATGIAYFMISQTAAKSEWVAGLTVDQAKGLVGSSYNYTPETAGKYTVDPVENATLGLADNSTYTAYLVIFNGATIDDSTSFYLTAEKEVNTLDSSTTNSSKVSFLSQAINSRNPDNWTAMAVPEPTSGLLLLVGMGALALRRKRA